MRNTPTYFPILSIFNLVANCVHFHVKWKKARHFDARTVDSFLLKRDWGSPCWTWMTRMVSKIAQMFILSISNCEWHCPVKSAPESENMSTQIWISSVYPINVRRTQNGKRDPDGRTYVDQVSPPTCSHGRDSLIGVLSLCILHHVLYCTIYLSRTITRFKMYLVISCGIKY